MIIANSQTSPKEHFDNLVEIYDTTGKCFSYWKDSMTFLQRNELMRFLNLDQFMWAKVLYAVEAAAMAKYKN